MIEIAASDVVFHFNKKFLEDSTIPMWVLKCRGKTYYVNHVDAKLNWSTKETPANDHTKGSIKFKNALIAIDDGNCATLTPLKMTDFARLKAKSYTRILISLKDKVVSFLNEQNIQYTPLKEIRGSCSSRFYICDIKKPNDITLMKLSLAINSFRILNENEAYYKAYDDDTIASQLDPDFNEESYEDDEDDEDENN